MYNVQQYMFENENLLIISLGIRKMFLVCCLTCSGCTGEHHGRGPGRSRCGARGSPYPQTCHTQRKIQKFTQAYFLYLFNTRLSATIQILLMSEDDKIEPKTHSSITMSKKI